MNIPLGILTNSELTSLSKLVYVVILDDANKNHYAFYSNLTAKDIAQKMNTSLLCVRMGLRKLYIHGLIKRKLNSDGRKVYHLVKLESDVTKKFFDGLETDN